MAKINYKWDSLVESLKEPMRLLILAVIAWLITEVVPQMNVLYAPYIVLFLRWLDKYVYEYKKVTKTDTAFKGIVGF